MGFLDGLQNGLNSVNQTLSSVGGIVSNITHPTVNVNAALDTKTKNTLMIIAAFVVAAILFGKKLFK